MNFKNFVKKEDEKKSKEILIIDKKKKKQLITWLETYKKKNREEYLLDYGFSVFLHGKQLDIIIDSLYKSLPSN